MSVKYSVNCLAAVALAAWCSSPVLAGSYATSVVSYSQGLGANAGYLDPNSALSTPARMTGASIGFPGVVSLFNPPFETDQLVSIGRGGQLTVHFDQPITNDASHLYDADLIVFGNSGFIDSNYPNGQIGNPASLFGANSTSVEVSNDGVTFVPVPTLIGSLFPTQGYLDSGPFDTVAGSDETDFFKPVNPALSLSSFNGLTFAQAMALYDGSGGGTPIDIASTGLSSVSYVRVNVAANASGSTEIDAFARVPEPQSAILILMAAAAIRRQRAAGTPR